MDRPFVFINCAMSLDGKIATKERKQLKISGITDFNRMDQLRSGSDAIMVGIGTVLADDPSLTVKSEILKKERVQKGYFETPVRVIVDSFARTPINADIFQKGRGDIIIATCKRAPIDRIAQLEKKARVMSFGEHHVDLKLLMNELKHIGVNRLMVEGGATLNWGLVCEDLVDEIYTFIGNMLIGGESAPTPFDGSGFMENEIKFFKLMGVEQMDEGLVLKWVRK